MLSEPHQKAFRPGDGHRSTPALPRTSALPAACSCYLGSSIAPSLLSGRMRSKLYLSAVAEASRLLGKRIKPEYVVEHLLHDNRFHVLFPSHEVGLSARSAGLVRSRSSATPRR